MVRRVMLGLSSLGVLGIAVGAAFAPRTMAEPLGYELSSTNALSEFRAIYVGLWLVHSWLMAWAAWRIDRKVLGDICGLLILGQVIGRLLSLMIDGVPDSRLLPVVVVEVVGAALILALRPPSAAPGTAG